MAGAPLNLRTILSLFITQTNMPVIGAFVAGCLLLSVLLGMIVIPNILLISYKKRLFDQPDARKVHTGPVPRLGGVSFFPVILITFFLALGLCHYLGISLEKGYPPNDVEWYPFLFLSCGGMMLYLVGVSDDLISVSYRYKFIVQIIAALLLTMSGTYLHSLGGMFGIHLLPAWVGIPLTVLVIVYITNAINLIDGIDGLASGLSCIALAVLTTVCLFTGQYAYAMLAAATLGILIPFWFYNVFGNARRGHRLFMGDTGSLMLGYILSFLVIRLSSLPTEATGTIENAWMIVAFSTLIVPLFDVVRVVLHRLRKGRNPFLPDKNHFHHKLLRTGMKVHAVMVTILLVSLFFIALNILLIGHINATWILLTDIILWTLMHIGINWSVKKNQKNNPSNNSETQRT